MDMLKANGYRAGTYQDDAHQEHQVDEKRAGLSESLGIAFQRAAVRED
jgi:hypothetical protein